MSAPSFALVVGLLYIIVGLAANLSTATLHPVLNIVHLLIGVWGFMAWTGYAGAVTFARCNALILGATAVLGFFPASFPSLSGLQVWLHAATAIAAAYFGWRSVLQRREQPLERRHTARADRRQAPHTVPYERRRGLADRRFGAGTTLTSE